MGIEVSGEVRTLFKVTTGMEWPEVDEDALFEMAGIPPLAGFFGKFYVFMAAINAGLYIVAVIGVLASVVGAFYYLRIVKVMYFDEPAEAFERPIGMEMRAIIAAASIFVVFFVFATSPFIDGAQAAAAALIP